LLISLDYFRCFLILATAWQRDAIFDRINAPANALRSEPLKRPPDVRMMPMLTWLAGIGPAPEIAHRRHAFVYEQTASALPSNPALAGKCRVK
jgi:hypothetical protein